MAFPNTSVTDIIATTLEHRSGQIADNVTGNNALLAMLKKKGKIRPFSGGRIIYEELSFAGNGNVGWYSGYDTLSTAAADVISAAQFEIKQAACPVAFSGLEELQNSGPEQKIDLIASRIDVAESSIANLISAGLYSDGTGSGSKQIT
ncbi:MAG: phage major capsid protein, partial [Planctomycetaceae bacterium]